MAQGRVAIFLSILAVSLRLTAQPGTTATGTVAGTVVDAETGAPIEGVSLTLATEGRDVRYTGPSAKTPSGASGPSGAFQIADVPVGRYTVRAFKAGLAAGVYGGRFAGDTYAVYFDVAAAQPTVVRVAVWQLSSISGTVLDKNGAPLAGATVVALRKAIVSGRLSLESGTKARTGANGAYTLREMTPGEYLVAIQSSALAPAESSSQEDSYATTFHPSTAFSSQAVVVNLRSAETQQHIDIRAIGSHVVRVSGLVSGLSPTAKPPDIELHPRDPILDFGTQRVKLSPDGRFTFQAVEPGDYVLRSVALPVVDKGLTTFAQFAHGFSMNNTGRTADGIIGVKTSQKPYSLEWSEQSLRVGDENVDDVNLSFHHGSTIQGQLVFEGTRTKPTAAQLRATGLLLMTADSSELGELPVTGVNEDGTFATVELPSGTYLMTLFPGWPEWSVRSVVANGEETFGIGIPMYQQSVRAQITLTDKISRVSGSVTEAGGSSASLTTTVVAFSTDPKFWTNYGPASVRIRQARLDPAGRYTMASLPSGDYFIVAVRRLGENYASPDELSTLAPSAVRIHLDAGQSLSQNLEVRR
jgi:hypothetical protein